MNKRMKIQNTAMERMKGRGQKPKRIIQAELAMTLLVFLVGCFIPAAFAASTLTLPTDTILIEEEAFYGDQSLKEVVLPEGIKRIENLGFAGSTVRKINLPKSLTYIADNAFEGCRLETISAEKGTYAYQWCREHGYFTMYRALLIGEETFWYDRENTRFRSDVDNMARMLSQVYGPKGGKYTINKRYDRTYNQICSDIQNCLGDAMIQDVSLFFITTHGNNSGDGELAMPDFSSKEYLPFDTLATWLTTYVKGEVIVIIQSCGSGSAIYDTAEGEMKGSGRKAGLTFDPDAFNEAAIRAFEKADTGLLRHMEIADSELNPITEKGELKKSTGDLRIPKYYVLTASNHQEKSYGMDYPDKGISYNYFPKWLIEGIGTKNQSPADISPKDGVVTLEEIYQYIKQYDTWPMKWKDSAGNWHTDYQHVQRYPVNSQYKLFTFE